MKTTTRSGNTSGTRGRSFWNRLRTRAAIPLAVLAIPVFSEGAESGLIAEARQALSENIPQVAIVKLKAALADGGIDSAGRATAVRLLAEAQLGAERPLDALETLATLEDVRDTESMLLRSLALAGAGRWEEALPVFHALAAQPGSPAAALIGQAECLQALGRTAEAIEILKAFVESGRAPTSARLRLASLFVELGEAKRAREILKTTPTETGADEHWHHYILARIHLLEKNPQATLDALAPIVGYPVTAKPAGLTQNLLAAAKLAEAEAILAKGGPDAAGKILESFIRQHPGGPHLEIAFRRLDQIYSLAQSPDENALLNLAAELPPRGAALAGFYLGRLQIRGKRYDRADVSLKDFLARFPDHALVPYVHAMLADAALAQGDLAGTEHALDAASRSSKSDDQKGMFALRTALVNLQQGEFVRASAGFRSAASLSPALRQSATFDAALAWLRQKNYERFADEFKVYKANFPDPVLAGGLRLEEGLVQARSRDPRATSTLRAFLAEFPDHPRRAEARLAFAELALNGGKPAEAVKLAEAVPADGASPEMVEQGEYLAVFLEDSKAPRDEEKVISRAREFIERHPSSALLGEVRMKLGEVYFRREDFLKAQEQFETLARQQPDSLHATPALFLAGQCAMKMLNDEALKRALELFGAVAEKHGPLEPHARLQQAIIKNKLGAPDDAVRIYDSILSAQQPVEAELRFAALTGKGDNLVVLGKTDPKQLPAAIAVYDQVIAAAGTSPTWRNQAGYKKAKVLHQLDRHDEAIAVFYDILQKSASLPRETFWFSKAGFDAAGIAEGRREWKSAVGIYEKMATIPGPHVKQATQRVKTLRLEHFLWD